MDSHSTCQIPHDQPSLSDGWSCKTAGEIQEVLQMKHILVSDCEHALNFKFDKAKLGTLYLSMHPIEVQGKSPSSPYWCFFPYQHRPVCLCRWGWRGWVMADDCYHQPTPRASTCTGWQILNALEFQMGLVSLDPPPKFSTDLLALRVAGRGIVPPTSDICWLWCMYLVPYRQQWAWGWCPHKMQAQNLDLLKGWWREVLQNQLLLRSRTGWDKQSPAGGCCAEARYSYVCGLFIFIYHCHSNLGNIGGSCVPILFMQLLHCFPPSVMESIFLAPPPCKIRSRALFTALWTTSK